jgi:hypothetical protein
MTEENKLPGEQIVGGDDERDTEEPDPLAERGTAPGDAKFPGPDSPRPEPEGAEDAQEG